MNRFIEGLRARPGLGADETLGARSGRIEVEPAIVHSALDAKWRAFAEADAARLAAIERLRAVAYDALEAVRNARTEAVNAAETARALWPGNPSDIPEDYVSDCAPDIANFAIYVAVTAQALARARQLSASLSRTILGSD